VRVYVVTVTCIVANPDQKLRRNVLAFSFKLEVHFYPENKE